MRFSEGVSRNTMMIVVAIISFACLAFDSRGDERESQVIDLGPFTFKAPSGDEWSADIKKDSGEAQFTRKRRSFFGGGLPLTSIHVSYASVLKEEMWKMTEEEIANDYREGEHGDMMIRGVLQGAYQLEDVKKDTITLNGKKLYTLSYKQSGGRAFGDDKLAESILYLYFPPDFKNRHTFYRILITTFNNKNKPVSFDTSPAINIINSINVK